MRSRQADTRFLELHRGRWRVTVATPRPLHGQLGSKLKRPLNTTSLATANALKWTVVAELRAIIERAARGNPKADQPADEAMTIAAHRAALRDPEAVAQLDEAVADRAEDMRGDPVDVEADADGRPVYIYDHERERRATAFADMARGRSTPIGHHHPAFLAQSTTKARTKGDDRRAIEFLLKWCGETSTPSTLQAIDRKSAVRFMDWLPTARAGLSPVTMNKTLSRLGVYWKWLQNRELVDTDPWVRMKLKTLQTPHDELERAFSMEEVRRLLDGGASQAMQDLMRAAALTGARLEALVDLRARDVDLKAMTVTFKPQKKERGPRTIPLNSNLRGIFERRLRGRSGAADLWPEYPVPKTSTSQRERSFAASREFTEFRRAVGVDEVVPGKRRSLVNFHSWRRFFCTMAERADQPEHLIAACVGHKRPGQTLGRYSSGPMVEQMRRVVEAVRLPQTGAAQ
jgi:integrase